MKFLAFCILMLLASFFLALRFVLCTLFAGAKYIEIYLYTEARKYVNTKPVEK